MGEDFLIEEEKQRLEEIERLRQWYERVAREKESNDKEASELAVIIAQEKLKPTLVDRVGAVESDVDDIVTVLATIEGVSV